MKLNYKQYKNLINIESGRMMKNIRNTFNILNGVILKRGLGSKSLNLCNNALTLIKLENTFDAVLNVFKIIKTLRTVVALYTKRVGGVHYKLPVFTHSKKQLFTTLKWIVNNARLRTGNIFLEQLMYEIMLIFKGQTSLNTKKDDIKKAAIYGIAFMRFIKRKRKHRRLWKLKTPVEKEHRNDYSVNNKKTLVKIENLKAFYILKKINKILLI